MGKLTIEEKTKVIYFTALQKTKKLKIKISNLECKYLEEAIEVMNLVSAFKKLKRENTSEYEAKQEWVAARKHELFVLEDGINKLRAELDENNSLLMMSCIESEDIIKYCLDGDWEAVYNGHEEFQFLHKAIRKIEGVS